MSTPRLRRLFGILLLSSRPPRRAVLAQDTGTVSGTVVDTTDQVVPGATVTLTNEATADARTAVTDERGEFTFRAVPPGTYTVPLELPGFRKYEQRNNVLNASGQLDLGASSSRSAQLSEVVTVASQGTTVETKNSDYSGLLTSTQISQIQTEGRDVVNLLRLLPGVHYEDDIEAMGDSFGSQIPNIGGQRRNWNQVTVDGLNGNELSGTSRMNSSINLDAIAEVKVLLNTYKAEFGHSGGANIEIVSKSGSNDLSRQWRIGTARRDAWNANPWENNRSRLAEAEAARSTRRGSISAARSRFPGSARARTRSCSSSTRMEAPQVQKPGPVRLYRMPTALERAGDFSQTFDANGRLMFIKDPLSTAACSVTTGGAGCFPGNVIPTNRLDANGAGADELTCRCRTSLYRRRLGRVSNFTRQETPENPRMNNLLRIDARPSGNNSFWASFRQFSSDQCGIGDHRGPGQVGFLQRHLRVRRQRRSTAAGTTCSASNKVNELRRRHPPRHRGVRHQGRRRSDAHPEVHGRLHARPVHSQLNRSALMPFDPLRSQHDGHRHADFTYDCRLGSTGVRLADQLPRQLYAGRATGTRSSSARTSSTCRTTRRAAATGTAQFSSTTTPATRSNTNFAFSNALLGVYPQYTETDKYRADAKPAMVVGVVRAGHLADQRRVSRSTTASRFLVLLAVLPAGRPGGRTSIRRSSTRSRRRGSTCRRPSTARVWRSTRPLASRSTRSTSAPTCPAPATTRTGWSRQTDAGVPPVSASVLTPQLEAATGLDVGPDRRRHDRAALERRPVPPGAPRRRLARQPRGNPPFIHNPIIYYGFLNASRARGQPCQSRRRRSRRSKPTTRRRAPSTGRSACDATSAGAPWSTRRTRATNRHNMEMYYDLNGVPDGARFTDLDPGEPRSDGRRNRDTDRGRPAGGISSGRIAATRTSGSAAIRPTVTTTRCSCR